MHEKLEVFASTGHEEEEEKIKKLLSVPKWQMGKLRAST